MKSRRLRPPMVVWMLPLAAGLVLVAGWLLRQNRTQSVRSQSTAPDLEAETESVDRIRSVPSGDGQVTLTDLDHLTQPPTKLSYSGNSVKSDLPSKGDWSRLHEFEQRAQWSTDPDERASAVSGLTQLSCNEEIRLHVLRCLMRIAEQERLGRIRALAIGGLVSEVETFDDGLERTVQDSDPRVREDIAQLLCDSVSVAIEKALENRTDSRDLEFAKRGIKGIEYITKRENDPVLRARLEYRLNAIRKSGW